MLYEVITALYRRSAGGQRQGCRFGERQSGRNDGGGGALLSAGFSPGCQNKRFRRFPGIDKPFHAGARRVPVQLL